ncbi:MAG: PIG-L deacetylase family protein [Anaerolineales bacterium]
MSGKKVFNRQSTVLAVFAHPDDETFRCGGTLARLARRGTQVWVLCATRGEAGIPDLGAEETGRIREDELRCASLALGIEPPRFLDYRDGTLNQVNEEEAVAQITAAVQELRPQVLLTWPPDGISGHSDHVAVSRWTDEVFRQMSEPAALYHIAMPRSLAQRLDMTHLHTVSDEAVTLAVDVVEAWEAKWAAIHCHRSQLGSSPILDASKEKQRLFLGMEHFRLEASRLAEPEEDILQRLKDNHT